MPVSFVETNKYIQVVNDNFVTAKKTGEVQIKIWDNNGKPFIPKLYNALFATDLCNQFFSDGKLLNSGHT